MTKIFCAPPSKNVNFAHALFIIYPYSESILDQIALPTRQKSLLSQQLMSIEPSCQYVLELYVASTSHNIPSLWDRVPPFVAEICDTSF